MTGALARAAAVLAALCSAFALAADARAPAASALPPPCRAGAPTDALRAVACRFFTHPDLGETRALLVVQNGVPLFEAYGAGYGPGNRFVSWSMAKSVTGVLVGMRVDDRALALDAPAPVAQWHGKDDPRAAITLRHLLHMAAGLQHAESGAAAEDTDTARILFSDRAADAAAGAIGKPAVEPPGTRFRYSTATSTILADIVARSLLPATPAPAPAAKREAMQAFLRARLVEPAGMASLVCEYDAAGTMLGGSLCHAQARDWARFGQLLLDGGRRGDRQIVSPQWLAFMLTPSRVDGGYGGHIWLNRPRPPGSPAALFPGQGPADAFAAIGHLGQYVIVVPSKRLVVVRLGKTQDDVLQPLRTALGRLVATVPDPA